MAADSLSVVAAVPTLDFRTAAGKGSMFSVQLTTSVRLRFEAADDAVPPSDGDGEIDLSRVSAIRILGVEELS